MKSDSRRSSTACAAPSSKSSSARCNERASSCELEAVGPVGRETLIDAARRARLGDRRTRRLRRRQTLGEVELHAADPAFVAVGVEPKAAG